MADYYVQYALHSEAQLTTNVQKILQPLGLDSWLVAFSEYFSPESLIDNVIPIIGTIDVELMGEMAFTLGLLNVISSVIKWVLPLHRPTWWIRENNHHRSINIKQSPYSCDTSPGFPSTHSMSFTGFVFIFLLYLKLSPRNRWLAVTLLSIPTWISCVYFGSHFLHQCICGSIVAVFVIESIRRLRLRQQQLLLRERAGAAGVIFMKSWRKTTAIAAVTTVALFVIGMYFAMLYAGLDPHWSVRMAFKWCPDPHYLRHETSPIFVMCRDLGFMMGIALSSPFTNRLRQRLEPWKSIPAVVVIMAVGFFMRSRTPKNYGRVVFVGYEFVRNAMHSFLLLTILPILCKKCKIS